MRACVWMFAAVVLSAPASAGAQVLSRTLTIDQAVNEAVERNLTLLAARQNVPIAEAAIISARLRPNPVLSGGVNNLDWLGTGFNDINNAGPQEYAVRIDMPFERAHKRELRTDLAEQGRSLAAVQLADAIRRLRLDVTLACVDVLEARAKLRLARDNLAALEQLVQLNQRRLTSGAIPELEVSRSRVAMLQYRGNVRTAELVLAQARLKLSPLLGLKANDSAVDVDDQLGMPPTDTSPDLETLQHTARAMRPDLLAAQRDQARSQADLRLQVAQGKVDYTFGAEYRRQQGVNGKGNMVGLFFSVPLPLFNRNQGEIARAGAEGEKAGRALTAAETDVASEVASAYAEFDNSRQLLAEIERDLLKPATDARAGTAYMYSAGATSLVDVLDAQRAYNDTMDTYFSAQASYRRAQARLTLTVGREALP